MRDILQKVATPEWLISVLVVGVLINVTSNFLQRWLDRRLTSTTNWWQRRRHASAERRNRDIAEWARHPERYTMLLGWIVTCFAVSVLLAISSLGLVLLVAVDEKFTPARKFAATICAAAGTVGSLGFTSVCFHFAELLTQATMRREAAKDFDAGV